MLPRSAQTKPSRHAFEKATEENNSLRDTAMRLRSQRPLHVQGDAGHPGANPTTFEFTVQRQRCSRLERFLEVEEKIVF
jgi:hypothetical protein